MKSVMKMNSRTCVVCMCESLLNSNKYEMKVMKAK